MKEFRTVLGIRMDDPSRLHTGYRAEAEGGQTVFTVVLSAEQFRRFLLEFVRLLPAPGYFTLELPVLDADEPAPYDVYYLDGCTIPVLEAAIRRYGDLLINDGLVRFGFASHEKPLQLYVTDMKAVQIYAGAPAPVRALLARLKIPEEAALPLPWEVVDAENGCDVSSVEVDGESVYDLIDLLKDAGLYFAQRREAGA